MHRTIEQEFVVRYSFPVSFTRNVFDPANPLLASVIAGAGPEHHRLLVFIDSGVLDGLPDLMRRIETYVSGHGDCLRLAAPPFVIRGGEQCKNDPAVLEGIQERIAAHHLCRQSFVLAIGGGAVLDTVGYGAATAHRGVRLIRLPTTVLGQNDAGVGVKNGINGFGRKNFLGTFAPPFAVIDDFAFLDTLPDRDRRAGIVEAVKVALIKNRGFFDFLFEARHRLAAFAGQETERMIVRCAELHLAHITGQGDPFEFGSARPLDFGHWSAHKLEELTNGEVRHGEAVAMGIALDALYCRESGMIRQPELDAILTLLRDLGLALYHPALADLDVAAALREFQEHLGGPLHLTLLTGIGRKKEVHAIDYQRMRRCVGRLAATAEGRRVERPEAKMRTIPARLGTPAADAMISGGAFGAGTMLSAMRHR
jgi:3-dehydroquinate synthase